MQWCVAVQSSAVNAYTRVLALWRHNPTSAKKMNYRKLEECKMLLHRFMVNWCWHSDWEKLLMIQRMENAFKLECRRQLLEAWVGWLSHLGGSQWLSSSWDINIVFFFDTSQRITNWLIFVNFKTEHCRNNSERQRY
jgi:hypothetical protein